MIEHIITSTIFILALFLIRGLFRNRISSRMCYALWILLAVKLLVPFTWLANDFNVMKYIAPYIQDGNSSTDEKFYEPFLQSPSEVREHNYNTDINKPIDFTRNEIVFPTLPENNEETYNEYTDYTLSQTQSQHTTSGLVKQLINGNSGVLGIIWLSVSILFGCILLISNLIFRNRLIKSRRKLDVKNYSNIFRETGKKISPLACPVYVSDVVNTPCLFGFLKPAIYVTEEFINGPADKLYHVITHEQVHYRHKDHIWAFVRCLILVLYWWHPLIWLAAKLSITDSELACDEGVIRLIGKDQVKNYGETLITVGAGKSPKSNLLACTTGIAGGKNELRLRIETLTKNKKLSLIAIFVVSILLLSAVGCTFGKANDKADNDYNSISLTDGFLKDGEQNWDSFKKAANSGKGTEKAPITIHLLDNTNDELFSGELTFDGEYYHYQGRKWKYLLDVVGITGNPKKTARMAALANEVYTYKELEWSMISSNSNDFLSFDLLFFSDANESEQEVQQLSDPPKDMQPVADTLKSEADGNKAETENDVSQSRIATTATPPEGAISIGFTPTNPFEVVSIRYFIPEGTIAEEKLFPAISELKPEHTAPDKWWEDHYNLGCYIVCNGITWKLINGNCLYTTIINENGEPTPILETPDTNWSCYNICHYILSILKDEFDFEPADVTKWTDITSASLEYKEASSGKTSSQSITDSEKLATLSKMLSEAMPLIDGGACPFTEAKLTITCRDGSTYTAMAASDDCPLFVTNGVYYDYRPKELQGVVSDDSSYTNGEFKKLFDEIPWGHY